METRTHPPLNGDVARRREIDTDPRRVRLEDDTADADPRAVELREIVTTLPRETK